MGVIPLRTKCVHVPRVFKDCVPLPVFAQEKYVHPNTVRYWIRIRKIEGYKHAGRWYVREKEEG